MTILVLVDNINILFFNGLNEVFMFLDPNAYGKAAAVRILFIYLITAPFYLFITLMADFSITKIVGVLFGFFTLALIAYLGTFAWYWFFAKLYNKYTKKNQSDLQE